MYSDNGSNFRAGEQEMRTAIEDWNQRAIWEFLCQKNISWKFNPPYTSHMGGIWECVIRSIRKILTALGQQLVNEEMLRTVMAEVQGILNSRPLTPASNDPKDLEPLTPNHLLLFRANPNLPPGVFVKEDTYCKRRWWQVQYMSDIFWKRCLKEYLPTLQLVRWITRPKVFHFHQERKATQPSVVLDYCVNSQTSAGIISGIELRVLRISTG